MGVKGLERRLIVEWNSTISWFQKALDKEILEVRPKGFVREFTGLLDFTLNFEELRAIVGIEPEADVEGESLGGLVDNGEEIEAVGDPVWRTQLASVRGVYIIQSDKGALYVGAAYGKRGFLGRWSLYARTNQLSGGAGDRVGLRENTGVKRFLDDGDSDMQRSSLNGLRFSIAHVMDKNAKAQDVLDMERWFKEKLGTRASALDLNEN